MQDGMIKGTGNSRYLKSISDFLTQYPTYQDFVAALVAGTLPIDLNGINPTGWDQLGTQLNTDNLLSAETAALLPGLPENPVPDDALKVMATRAPTGTVLWYASETIPDGYLLCDGSAVSRADYAALFAVIGTTFGTGDGSTTFALPDLRAAFIRGAGTSESYHATFGGKQNATGIPYLGQRPNNADYYTSTYYSNFRVSTTTQALTTETYYIRPYNLALTPIIKY